MEVKMDVLLQYVFQSFSATSYIVLDLCVFQVYFTVFYW